MDAIEYFKGMRKRLCEDHLKLLPKKSVGYQTTLKEMSFYDAAIKALEQEPCEDAISRSEAIRVASGYCHWSNIPDELAKLPSVNPIPCEDAISRQAAIDAMATWDWQELYLPIHFKQLLEDLPSVSTENQNRCGEDVTCTVTCAVTCTDAISRSEAIRIASGYCHWTNIPDELAKLPSVNTEKTGRWITQWNPAHQKEYYYCSECREEYSYDGETGIKMDNYKFCPNCGCRMVEPQESEGQDENSD